MRKFTLLMALCLGSMASFGGDKDLDLKVSEESAEALGCFVTVTTKVYKNGSLYSYSAKAAYAPTCEQAFEMLC